MSRQVKLQEGDVYRCATLLLEEERVVVEDKLSTCSFLFLLSSK